jgi:DNA repair exonuclease SbcCD ATPase subunit
LSELDASVDQTSKLLTAAVETLQSSETELSQQLTSAREDTSNKFDILHGQMGSMESAVAEVQEQSQEAVANLGEKIQEQQASLSSRAEELTTECGSLIEIFEDLVTDIHLDVLTGGVEAMLEAATQKIESEAKEILHEMLGEVTNLLEELAEKITDSSGETAEIRDAIAPLIDQIDDMLAPLDSLIDAVKSVTGVFGSIASIF